MQSWGPNSMLGNDRRAMFQRPTSPEDLTMQNLLRMNQTGGRQAPGQPNPHMARLQAMAQPGQQAPILMGMGQAPRTPIPNNPGAAPLGMSSSGVQQNPGEMVPFSGQYGPVNTMGASSSGVQQQGRLDDTGQAPTLMGMGIAPSIPTPNVAGPAPVGVSSGVQQNQTGGASRGAQQMMSAPAGGGAFVPGNIPMPAPVSKMINGINHIEGADPPSPSPFMQNVANYGQQYGPNAYDFIPGVNDVQAKIAASQNMMNLLNSEGSSNSGNPWTVDAVMKLSNPNQGLDYWNDVASKWAAGQHPLQPS